MTTRAFSSGRRDRGQTLIEFAVVMPLLCLVLLGVVEVSYALLDQHVVTRLTREGSNLISRDATLQDAATALRNMATRPVNFSGDSKVIFSVIRNVPTIGAANYNKVILYQRYEYGGGSGSSVLGTRGSASFGGPPDYQAANADSNSALQIANLPANVSVPLGGMVYVTEIYSAHTLITPFDKFGVSVPNRLYSIAYF